MCGIAGAIALRDAEYSPGHLSDIAMRMASRIAHRGPDGSGWWAAPDGSVVLAHRRLAIVDLSIHGRQPMAYLDGRYRITFNGEIYNFRQLTKELRGLGHTFQSSGDTEVLLAAVAEWGLEAALRRMVGMFALALWDSNERTLHLARDRAGEKPLYVCQVGDYLYFASESRALSVVPNFTDQVSVAATAAYLRDGYVPEPLSIYEGIFKLPPGTTLSVPAMRGASLNQDERLWSREPGSPREQFAPRAYWSVHSVVDQYRNERISNPIEATHELETLLRASVRDQMNCDVPTGAFLSGGIDSSLVAAIMQAESTKPIQTFTVGFENAQHDESESARRVAQHIGSIHNRIVLTDREIAACVPDATRLMDEPTANGSFFPVHLISKFARQHVKVALSGDGGDELFAGYNRYWLTQRTWSRIRPMPGAVRLALRRIIEAPNYRFVDRWGQHLGALLPVSQQVSLSSSSYKLSRLLCASSLPECYAIVTSCWPEATLSGYPMRLRKRLWPADAGDDLSGMLLCDQLDYLPGDSLAKIDRASMAVGLETRLPLLDHRIIEFSWRISGDLKLRDGVSKFVLRQVLEKFVPRRLTDRRKMGFSSPTDRWLRGPLRSWAQDLLASADFRWTVPLLHDKVFPSWRTYLHDKRPTDYQMWSLVMLAAWAIDRRRKPVDGSGTTSTS
jgi:asparagine synthase (glutamine-hydrolysing)